jgi:beta-lactam-binding protein with PASTA domain
VPVVVGLEKAKAEAKIRGAGFTPSVVFREVVNPKKDGNVLSQTPQGGKEHRRGGTIVITVGQLTEPAAPPTP